MLSKHKIFNTLTQKDALALTTGLRLSDDDRILLLFHILPEIVEF
jgi:hypothetical protein